MAKLALDEGEKTDTGTPIRYLPLDHIYSSSAPCITAAGSSNVISKKVKARKLIDDSYLEVKVEEEDEKGSLIKKRSSSILQVYTRKKRRRLVEKPLIEVKIEIDSADFDAIPENGVEFVKKIGRSGGSSELANLGIDSSFCNGIGSSGRRERRRPCCIDNESTSRTTRKLDSSPSSVLDKSKKWLELSFENVVQNTLVGFKCKVYWPYDDDWYAGCVASYNSETGKHHVKYEDGDDESLLFSKERVRLYISREEMQRLNLKQNFANTDKVGLNEDELLVLAAIFDDCSDIEAGDIIWVKLSGHAIWPAVVVNVNESDVGVCKGFKAKNGERSLRVQFFGTHDFARITMKQVISFLRGLQLSYHLKCKQTRFRRSLEEAKVYLSEQKLPEKMLRLQNGIKVDHCDSDRGEDDGYNSSNGDVTGDKRSKSTSNCIKACPFEVDGLRVVSLGNIVMDSEHFHDERYIWPEGYTAERRFISAKDPNLESSYKMEVLRDFEVRFRPLFKVTMDSEEEFKGPNPSACWNKIYRRIKKIGGITSNGFSGGCGLEGMQRSGSHMFGFSNPRVSKIIKELSNCRKSSKYSGCKLGTKRYQDLPVGYMPIHIEWKDLDKCNVCNMDEEYADNVFLQCDKCRMMVHARCYGELEPVDGVLWLCKLCHLDAPEFPPCCLCPVIGGAMKPTTDERWAHLACAIWIPETCLSDIKRMEPIDGLKRVNKDRWKLLCSLCGVAYGACIQCSNSTCRVAYHPLCARDAGLCVELEDEDKLHLMSFDEDEDDQCIRLFSFCKKHRQPSKERSPSNEQMQQVARHCSKYIPSPNPSGCARCEPSDYLAMKGRKDSESVAPTSLKRLYVENRPYLVTGYCQNGTVQNSSSEIMLSGVSPSIQKLNFSHLDTSKSVLSMAEKYDYMRKTFKMGLAFGKSGIHRFGVFARRPYKPGDMVIEYTGELVRPSIADRREHLIYNSLVGAGTYMFRINDEHVIDATRAGSIAHLINHSCEPNCYSRVVTIHGEEHIIIFAKRDISIREELTYDYRFFSIGEHLACYCGFPGCRGVVNDIDAEDQVAKLWVPRSALIDWREEKV